MPRLFVASDIEDVASAGRRELVVDVDAIVSPLAQDRARELGVEIRRGLAHAGSRPSQPPAPPGGDGHDAEVRRILREVMEEIGGDDLRRVVREALARLRSVDTPRPAGPRRSPGRERTPASALTGQVAVVTGAASGIGRACAVELARSGVDVVLGTHEGDPHDVGATETLVDRAGGRSVTVNADVRSGTEVGDLCDTAVDTYGRLDIAVANAGVLRRDRLEDLTDEAWNAVVDVDLGGVLRTFRAAATRMHGGSLIAVGSIAGGVFGWAEHAHYAAAKAGVLGLVRSLAAELGPVGIRVNAVLPGLIETPQSLDETASIGAAGLRSAASSVPLRRIGDPDDVASAVRFLASSDAAYISGQALVVDGGISTSLTI